MTTVIRLLSDRNKQSALREDIAAFRNGVRGARTFDADPDIFEIVEGSPFPYWISDSVRRAYEGLPTIDKQPIHVKSGLSTADDFRFLRLHWEVACSTSAWRNFSKGGRFSRYYFDLQLMVHWGREGVELSTFPGSTIRNPSYYGRCGLTWPSRTKSHLSVRMLPSGCVFGHKGPGVFAEGDEPQELLSLIAILNSSAYYETVKVQLAAAGDAQKGGVAHSFEVGVIQKTPLPNVPPEAGKRLAERSHRAWTLKRALDSINETSHAFLLPANLRCRIGNYDPPAIEAELEQIQTEIDEIAFQLYGFSSADRAIVLGGKGTVLEHLSSEGEDQNAEDDDSDDDGVSVIDNTAALLSWAVGVAFGRFDWRLSAGERAAPPEPGPFDPLPAKSPGMLPDGAAPFHEHGGILVDDQGNPHDLARLIEEVLACVEVPVPDDVRRWLQRDFFAFHLQRYSKSRRKAPIYWPLATTSGSYTLWVYYPSLTSQTLYTAINDFVEPKLQQVGADVAALRNKGSARSRDDEKQFESLQALELELIELRDTLLKLAPTYKPNHDDGVQISAAPLWPLFRHKPWQKVLKETWTKLEKGDYDWAHLAMNYWPERVREKCKTDKSLAIAHGLEHLYVEPEAQPKKTRGRKKAGGDE